MRNTVLAITLTLTACTTLPPLPPPAYVAPDSNQWGAKVADVVQIDTDIAIFARGGEKEAKVKSLHSGKVYYCSFKHKIQPGQYFIFWTNETYTHATEESAAACCRWLHNNWFLPWKSTFLLPQPSSCLTAANKFRISLKYTARSIHPTKQLPYQHRGAA